MGDEITKHEDDGKECDQCERWLCYGMSIERHKKRKHGTTSEEGKMEEVTENQKEGEIIKNGNDGQECDQCGKWICDGMGLKRHKKKEQKPPPKKKKKKKKKK